jgi:hypothetical protein
MEVGKGDWGFSTADDRIKVEHICPAIHVCQTTRILDIVLITHPTCIIFTPQA